MVSHVLRRPIASPVLGEPLFWGHRTLPDVNRRLVGSNPLADRVVELDDVDVVGRLGPRALRWILRAALLLRHRASLFPSVRMGIGLNLRTLRSSEHRLLSWRSVDGARWPSPLLRTNEASTQEDAKIRHERR